MNIYLNSKNEEDLKLLYERLKEINVPIKGFITKWGVRLWPKNNTILNHYGRFDEQCSTYGFIFDEYDKQEQLPAQLINNLEIESVMTAFSSYNHWSYDDQEILQTSSHEMEFMAPSFSYHAYWPWSNRQDKLKLSFSTDMNIETAQEHLTEMFQLSKPFSIRGSKVTGFHSTCGENASSLHKCSGVLAPQVKRMGDSVWDTYIATSILPSCKEWISLKKNSKIKSWLDKEDHVHDPVLAIVASYAVVRGTASARIHRIATSDEHVLKRQKTVNNVNSKIFGDDRRIKLASSSSCNVLMYEAQGNDIITSTRSIGRHLTKEPATLDMLVEKEANISLAQFASSMKGGKLVAAVGHHTSPVIDKDAYDINNTLNSELFKYSGIMASITHVKEYNLFEEIQFKAARSYELALAVAKSIRLPDQESYLNDIKQTLKSI